MKNPLNNYIPIDGNPFIYNTPVHGADFINREELINDLLVETLWKKDKGNIWLTGLRKTGKTSLLGFILSKYGISKNTIPVYGKNYNFKYVILYTNVQDCDTKEKFYQNLEHTVKNYFDFKFKKPADPLNAFIESIEHAFKNNYYLLFLVDEFDAFLQNLINKNHAKTISFLGELNKLAGSQDDLIKSPKVFSCIFTANNSYTDILKQINVSQVGAGSGLITIGKELSPFTKEQVAQLARQYLKGSTIRFSKKEMDYCFELTDGYPYFVQRLFFIMFEFKKDKTKNDKLRQYIKDKFTEICNETILSWGSEKTPSPTLKKFLDFAKYLGDKTFDKFIQALIDRSINP
jgi:hypothetical protein